MSSSSLHRLRRLVTWVFLELILAAAVMAFSVWADTSGRAKERNPGCYCGCAMSKTTAGCSKMCELPKYASRWWAVTCAKPRSNPPAENPGAGPRLPRPARAERAAN
ncbi:MAG TPA: hypothetical protein VN830_00510 [Verrucomicrobiae bacterium]|nr:hypothetical protein [Verrucomicrobiae bacterium]